MSVYPDSDKVSVAPTRWGGEPYDRMMVPRDAGVDYWYGEGDGGRHERAEVARQPAEGESLPVVNALRDSAEVSGSLLTVSAVELAPGDAVAPYRYEVGREEWVLAIEGSLRLRHPEGELELAVNEAVACPDGPAGARQLSNGSAQPARALLLSTTGLPSNVCYPDTGRWLMRNAEGEELLVEGPSR